MHDIQPESDVQKTLFYNAISMVLRSRRRVAGVENMENHWNMHTFFEEKCVKIDFWSPFRFVKFRGDILTPKTVSYTMECSEIDFPVLEVQKRIELQAFTIGFACRILFLEKSKIPNICSAGGYRGWADLQSPKRENG